MDNQVNSFDLKDSAVGVVAPNICDVKVKSAGPGDLKEQKILDDIDEWQDEKREAMELNDDKEFNPVNAEKKKEEFRNYQNSARQKRVENLYRLQHTHQTYAFVERMEAKWLSKFQQRPAQGLYMGIWEALEFMTTVDESDPDTNFTQIMHALQTAESIRKKWSNEEDDWFVLTGLIHDLGKIMAVDNPAVGLAAEAQWAVVGDTFPVGCPFSQKNVFPQFFAENPDSKNPLYNQGLGIYQPGCGLRNVKMSWGHDEYLYRVCVGNNSTLPQPALYMIRYHSFYPWHKEGAYQELLDDHDREMFKWVKEFNQFDLYSKADEVPDVQKLKPYYQKLISKYFPEKLLW
jgi:inositol oxygenase